MNTRLAIAAMLLLITLHTAFVADQLAAED